MHHHTHRARPFDSVARPLTKAGETGALLTGLGSVVYAIRCGDLIKIGHTGDLAKRAAFFGGYANILAWRLGTLDDEQAIHARLNGLSVRGREYYPVARPIMDVVNEMRKDLGIEILQVS